MKILIYGNLWHGSLEECYVHGFESQGSQVFSFDPHKRQTTLYASSSLTLWQRFQRKLRYGILKEFWRKLGNRRFVAMARSVQPDLILVIKGTEIDSDCIVQLREATRSLVFLYHPDNPFIATADFWNRYVLETIPLYDCHLVFGKFLVPLFAQRGARRAECIPFAYDPQLLDLGSDRETVNSEMECDIAFAGTWDPERERWLSVLARDFQVSIWGNEWEHCKDPKLSSCWERKPVYGREFARVCRAAKLSFNYVRTENNRSSHNMRTFEIPACGGLALTNRTEEQVFFFKEDEEIVCFESESELLQKVHSLLHSPERISEMKRKALAAGRSHTYQKRAEQICELAGGRLSSQISDKGNLASKPELNRAKPLPSPCAKISLMGSMILGTVGALFLAVLGWGFWGYGFGGEYAVELGDALRIYQKAIPYKEFVPTYGILYPALVSAVFNFGKHAIDALFLFTLAAVLIQLWCLIRLKFLSNHSQQYLFVLLYLGLAVFSLTEANFLVGFSQSSLLAALLFGFTLLMADGLTPRRAVICGFLLGLQCFTKMDATLPAMVILLVLALANRRPKIQGLLFAAYVATWATVLGFLMLCGAKWEILVESTTEVFFAASVMAPEALLKKRMILTVLVLATIFAAGIFKFRWIRRKAGVLWFALFPAVAWFDLLRGGNDPRKELVGIKWYLFCVVTWLCLRVVRTYLRHGHRMFSRARLLRLLCLLVICFFAFARVYLSGWYSLGYMLPFALLAWMASSLSFAGLSRTFHRVIYTICFAVALIFIGRAAVKYGADSNLQVLNSPYGKLCVPKEVGSVYSKFAEAAVQAGGAKRTFSSFPLISLVMGSSSVNYYSVMFRLQWSRPYESQKELALRLLEEGDPEIILLDNTTSQTRKIFGSDYAQEILAYIERYYEPVASYGEGFDPRSRKSGGTLYKKRNIPSPVRS